MKSVFATFCLIASIALADEAKNLLKPTNKLASWRLEQHDKGKGSMKPEEDAMVLTVSEIDGTEWHVQAIQSGLDLTEGKLYTLKFQIKASERRSVGVQANIDQDDYHTIGLAESITVGPEFTPQELSFRAENVAPKKNRIGLLLGDAKGTVTVKDMTLTGR